MADKLIEPIDSYRAWMFDDDVKFIPRDAQWKKYFDSKFSEIDVDIDVDGLKKEIKDTLNEGLEGVNENIEKVDKDVLDGVEEVKDKIDTINNGINKNIEHTKNALSCKIHCAENHIIRHVENVDKKIIDINFEEKFSNLNEQVEKILERLPENTDDTDDTEEP